MQYKDCVSDVLTCTFVYPKIIFEGVFPEQTPQHTYLIYLCCFALLYMRYVMLASFSACFLCESLVLLSFTFQFHRIIPYDLTKIQLINVLMATFAFAGRICKILEEDIFIGSIHRGGA